MKKEMIGKYSMGQLYLFEEPVYKYCVKHATTIIAARITAGSKGNNEEVIESVFTLADAYMQEMMNRDKALKLLRKRELNDKELNNDDEVHKVNKMMSPSSCYD